MSTSTPSTSPSDRPAGAAPVQIVRLEGAVVGVPDPQRTAEFFAQALDFDPERGGDGAVQLWCAGDYLAGPQLALTLVAREQLGLVRVRFTTRDGATSELRDPGGIAIACGPATRREPIAAAALRPRRLGHVNLSVPDPVASARFLEEQLGMRVSERIADRLYFLRLGTEHHNIGLRPAARGDVHHLGFEVAGWEAYRPILDRMADLGHQIEYGPGRHEIGANMFVYLRDPHSGLRVELFCDMAQIRDEAGYVAREWGLEDRLSRTINRWGPLPPESFLA